MHVEVEELENQRMVDGELIKRKCLREEESDTVMELKSKAEVIATFEAILHCSDVELDVKKTSITF